MSNKPLCRDPKIAKPIPSDKPTVVSPSLSDSTSKVLPDPKKFLHEKFNPVELMSKGCDLFFNSFSGLACFVRASLQGTTRTVEGCSCSDLWPVPPPRWRWTADASPNPRRRRRRRYLEVRHKMLQLVIASLNWTVLGHPKSPPVCAQLGAPISCQQHLVIERFERMLDHFLHMSDFQGTDLGRVSGKFGNLIGVLQELPFCSLGLEDLERLFCKVHADLDPYQSHFVSSQSSHHPDQTSCASVTGCRISAAASQTSAKPVHADRVKWENPPSFEARDFLEPLTRAAFDDPETLRKDPNEWPRAFPGKMHITREEMLKLIDRWDALGACRLIDAASKDYREAVGIFCVDKDEFYDRLIINPKTINSRMHSIAVSTKELAPGSMLGLLSLGPGEVFRFNADDLTDFYYTFRVSEARSRRNAFRMKFQSQELSHLTCYDDSMKDKEILVCLSTLAMGDSLAVEIAQQSHCNVLKVFCGAMDPSECLRYRSPIPRGDFVELLAIDDHVGIQRVPKSSFKDTPYLRDSHIFDLAAKAYKTVGLVQQEKKRKRNQLQGIILGADFDGLAGIVMGPRNRIAILCILTSIIATKGTCTPKLLQIILGCWIHVLLFRRALFSVIDQLFHEGRDLDSDSVFCLSRQAICELQLLAVLGPLAQSNLRASFCDTIFCTDASPSGGAVIGAKVSSSFTREIWRHCEQRGYYTRLQSPVSEILQEKGYEPESNILFNPEAEENSCDLISFSVPPPMAEGVLYDCIELFRGTGNWSEAHASRGFRVHDGVDVSGRRLRYMDLSSNHVTSELIALALRGVCRDWHAGVPCPSFGTLRRPQVRSKAFPAGFNPDDPYTKYHNQLARRACFILTIAMLQGQFISFEQPGNSRLFLLHCYRTLVSLGCAISHFCFCSFGSAFQKASKWLHNKPWLVKLECKCSCKWKGKHLVVRGGFTKHLVEEFDKRCSPNATAVYGRKPSVGESVASFSAAYPQKLVHSMASGLDRASRGQIDRMPDGVRIRSLLEVGLMTDDEHVLSHVPESPFAPRPWFEDPEWIGELCDSLSFRELFRFRFKKPGHINVNEARTYKSWIKSLAKSHPDSRAVGLLDSRVTIGSAAKGRSSSYSISRVHLGALAYVLGAGLFPGLLHCSSKQNRADGPSRGRPLESPSKLLPRWAEALLAGDVRRFDLVVQSSNICKNPARWLRFLLMLCGDIESNPGPRRGKMDLTVGFVKATSDRMQRCFDAFLKWIEDEAQLSALDVLQDMQALAWLLRGYGMHLFEQGHPRYLLVYAITAAQDKYPACRQYLSVAWQVDKKWQFHEPGCCRAVLPTVIIKAISALAALWHWDLWLGIFLLGFAGMLHPAEMMTLVRRDLVFPKDLHGEVNALYVQVRDPKTARFARRQHCRIDDVSVIQVASALYDKLELGSRLYPGSINTFRKQWNALLQFLGVPHRQADRGATPGVLRGSGATFYYTMTEDLSWISWRGRWARQRTLEYYLQEVGSQLLIHQLSPVSKSTIFSLADVSAAVIWRFYTCSAGS